MSLTIAKNYGKLLLRRRNVFGLLLLLVAAIVAWRFLVVGSTPALAYRFVAGQRLVYQLEYSSASASNLAVLTDDEAGKDGKKLGQAIFTDVETELVATVVEADGDGARIAFQLRRPQIRVVSNGELAIPQAETIQDDLQRTFLADVDRRGRIRSVRFEAGVSPLSHAFARALLAATQVVLPDAPAEQWQTREDDPNGVYDARYTLQATAAERIELTKSRTAYRTKKTKQTMHTFEAKTTVEPSGQVTAHFDAGQGLLDALEGSETTAISVEGRIVARAETTLRLKLRSRETIGAAEHEALRKRVAELGPAVALSAPADAAAGEAAIQRAALGDATLDSLLADLAKFEANSEAKADDTPLYLKLKALVYLHPEACRRLGDVLATAKAESPSMPMLAGALSSVGHAQAQAALQTAIRARPGDWPALTLLVPALGTVDQPTLGAEETLRELAGKSGDANIRTTAQLSLGMMARQLADTAPERATRIVKDALEQLRTATTDADRRQMLLVLGNIGAAETLEAIAAHVADATPEVRVAAVGALRWLEADAVDQLLSRVLSSDADAAVRAEAAAVIGLRPAAAIAGQKLALVNALAKDESPTVRLAVLGALARAARFDPDLRDLLSRVAAEDGSEDVRNEAGRLLGELSR